MYWGLLSFYKLSSLYWDFVFLLISCIGDSCAEDFAFYDISYVLETLSFYKLSLYTENFELLVFSPCIRDFVLLTSFPMYWELLSFYKLSPCTEDFVNVYEFPPVLKTLSFYNFPLVLETRVFIRFIFLCTRGLTNRPPYTGTLYFY